MIHWWTDVEFRLSQVEIPVPTHPSNGPAVIPQQWVLIVNSTRRQHSNLGEIPSCWFKPMSQLPQASDEDNKSHWQGSDCSLTLQCPDFLLKQTNLSFGTLRIMVRLLT